MRILCDTIKDTFYPPAPIRRERDAVRGIVLNDQKEIALLHMLGRDVFADRDHYELPGGGVEPGESFEETLHREMGEEIGLEIEIMAEVGIIANEYNRLQRRDVQHFYLARAVGEKPMHRTALEQKLVRGVVWVPAGEILHMYDTRPVENVGIEVHQRDRLAVAEALKIGKELGVL